MKEQVRVVHKHVGGGGGAVYILGMVGSLIYFFQQASNFSEILLGIIKSIFWPAFLIYSALGVLKM